MPKVEKVEIGKLKDLKISELSKVARDLKVNGVSGLIKQDLMRILLELRTLIMHYVEL